jgi:hypothetical protein
MMKPHDSSVTQAASRRKSGAAFLSPPANISDGQDLVKRGQRQRSQEQQQRRETTMNIQSMHPNPQPDFSGDLLRGADKIAEFLFGDAGERRKVYHLAESSRLPVFRLGSLLCARRSVLLDWVSTQERRGAKP